MPKHPHTRNLTPEGKWNINRFTSANGEADVQPSLLPGDFIIPLTICQGLFPKIFGLY